MRAPPFSSIEAVTFDLDGTLYRARPARLRFAWSNLKSMRAVRVRQAVRAELRASVFDDGDAFFREETRLCAERLEREPESVRSELDHLFGPRFSEVLRRVGPRTDARDVLERLVAANIKIAVVSDFSVHDKLAALGLDDLPFSARIAADACGALKPHPRAFEAAAAALGCPATSIVHVGDREDTDVRGAIAAGQNAVLLAAAPLDEITCVSSLSELLPLIGNHAA